MSVLAVEKASLVLFVALFTLWEACRPARPPRGFIEPLDVFVLVTVVISSLACRWLLAPFQGFDAAPLAGLPLAAKFIVALIAIDFVLYWLHRGMHTRRLWSTHRLHHSVKQMNWLKGAYMSGPHIAMYLVPQALLGYYVFGFSQVETAVAVVLGYFVQLWQHANVTVDVGVLKYVFVTPQSHRLHHALGAEGRDKNFGAVLSVWDVLFGTYAAPRHEDYELGVADEVPVVRGLIGV